MKPPIRFNLAMALYFFALVASGLGFASFVADLGQTQRCAGLAATPDGKTIVAVTTRHRDASLAGLRRSEVETTLELVRPEASTPRSTLLSYGARGVFPGQTEQAHGLPVDVAVAADGKTAALVTASGEAWIGRPGQLERAQWLPIMAPTAVLDAARPRLITPEGVWDLDHARETVRAAVSTNNPPYAVALAPDGRTAASILNEGQLVCWSTDDGAVACQWAAPIAPTNLGPQAVFYAPDGRPALIVRDADRQSLYQLGDDSGQFTLLVSTSTGERIRSSPDGRFVSLRGDAGWQLYDLATGRLVRLNVPDQPRELLAADRGRRVIYFDEASQQLRIRAAGGELLFSTRLGRPPAPATAVSAALLPICLAVGLAWWFRSRRPKPRQSAAPAGPRAWPAPASKRPSHLADTAPLNRPVSAPAGADRQSPECPANNRG